MSEGLRFSSHDAKLQYFIETLKPGDKENAQPILWKLEM